jgi:hypothetical protein
MARVCTLPLPVYPAPRDCCRRERERERDGSSSRLAPASTVWFYLAVGLYIHADPASG